MSSGRHQTLGESITGMVFEQTTLGREPIDIIELAVLEGARFISNATAFWYSVAKVGTGYYAQ